MNHDPMRDGIPDPYNMRESLLFLARDGWTHANKERRLSKGFKWIGIVAATTLYFFCLRLLFLHDDTGWWFLGGAVVWTWVADMNVRNEWKWEQRLKFWDEQIRILTEDGGVSGV